MPTSPPSRHSRSLSPPCQQLLILMLAIPFGKIKGLRVSQGEPTFTPRPVIAESGRPNTKASVRHLRGATLPDEYVQLFNRISQINRDAVMTITISDSLPITWETEYVAEIG